MDGRDDEEEVTDLHQASLAALRVQLAAARDDDDGSDRTRQAHVDAACALIVALVHELEEGEADVELAGFLPLVEHDPRLEIDTRRRLARELLEIGERDRANAQLHAAYELACINGLETLEADLGVEQLVLVTQQTITNATPDIAAHHELALASGEGEGEGAEVHTRAALEHARRAGDPALLHAAARALAEVLVAREAFVEAEALLEELPDDQLETRALLEEIWRRLGSHLEDEPDEPDEPGELERPLRAYITKPRSFAQALVDGGLPAPDRIREWSYGQLFAPADLESQRIFGPVRSFWCACGRYRGRAYRGIVCKRCGVELIHAASRRVRSGHIVLAEPVAHPWYVPAAAMLLDKPAPEIEAMPAVALRDALAEIDLEWLSDDIKRAIVTAPKAKIADAAGKRLAVVEAFRSARTQAYTRPEHIVLDIVPVVPPHGELGCERAPVRDAYAQLLDGEVPRAAIRRLFDALSAR